MSRSLSAGKDIQLRPLKSEDAKPLFELTEANRRHLRRWLPWLDRVTKPTHTRAFIRQTQKLIQEETALVFGVWWRGRLAGVVGFNAIDRNNRSAFIGYWLGAEFQGQGIMTSAVRRLITHGFKELNLHRIEIRVAVRNRRSRAIPRRLGFKKEGNIRQAEWLYDRFVDHAVYSLLVKEWSPKDKNHSIPAA